MTLTAVELNDLVERAVRGLPFPCVELTSTSALTRLTVEEGQLRPGRLISGPSQFQLADTALWYAAFGAMGSFDPMVVTSEMSIRFLRPAQGDVLWARAEIDQCGRRNVVGTIRLWVDDRPEALVSVAQGTYVRPRT